MKTKKLDMRGFSHDFVIVLFVMIFAISGVAYLVASHADSCDNSTSGTTSGATSGVVSDTTSGATSGADSGEICPASDATSTPVSESTTLSASCAINNVVSKPAYGQVISPTIVLTNTGTQSFPGRPSVKLIVHSANGAVISTQEANPEVVSGVNPTQVIPGSNLSRPLTSYTVKYSSQTNGASVEYVSTGSNPAFSCSASLTLPTEPTTTPPATPTPLANILVEGEKMTGNVDRSNQSDSTASSGKSRALYHSGYQTGVFTSKGKLTGVTVRARGSMCSGAPTMLVSVDGKQVSSTSVTSTTWTDYRVALAGTTKGAHTVKVTFPNDRWMPGSCDRNLFLDVVTLTQKS